MGYCRKCNNYVEDWKLRCPECGSKDLFKDKPVDEVKIEKVVEPGPWKVFAKVGYILGIISFISGAIFTVCHLIGFLGVVLPILILICLFICLLSIMVFFVINIQGLIFSILGLISETNKQVARKGLVFNVIGIVLVMFVFIVWYIVLDVNYFRFT